MNLSIKYRGYALWNNIVTNDHSIFGARCTALPSKLIDNTGFLNFLNFKALSISTTDLHDTDFLYY